MDIGLAFAKHLQATDSQVIAVGRRTDKFREAQQHVPELLTYQAYIAQPAERVTLPEWAAPPTLNVLLNKAGILSRVAVADLVASPEA